MQVNPPQNLETVMTQEWTIHRIAKSGRFENFIWEPGFNLNSLRIQEKNGFSKHFVLDTLLCCDGGSGSYLGEGQ